MGLIEKQWLCLNPRLIQRILVLFADLQLLPLSLLIILTCNTNFGAAQELNVVSFLPLEKDLTARTIAPERDANGELSALIKVVTIEAGFIFEGGSLGIVKAEQHEGEWWVYVPQGARNMTIRHAQLGVLRNYAYPMSISGGNVYEMKLVHGELEVRIKKHHILTEFVMIDSEPEGADVYLNNELMGKTPFRVEQPEGKYEWRLERELYLADAGVFELKAGDRQRLHIKMKPNYGTVEVGSQPEGGAAISLNGIKMGRTTPIVLNEIPPGDHNITVTHPWYETKSENVTISAGEKKNVTIVLQPNFAELTVEAMADEQVYINDNSQGLGQYTGRHPPGVYRIELRKAGHQSASTQITLERGRNERVKLTPEPILSNLKVLSSPDDAEIYLNGTPSGTTPYIVRDLLVGNYELELRKEGYATVKERVTVKEGEVAEVNLSLSNWGRLVFNSEPPEAEVYQNGVFLGQTPYTTDGLPENRYNFELRKVGYQPLMLSAVVETGVVSQIYKTLKPLPELNSQNQSTSANVESETAIYMQEKGRHDSRTYYKGKKSGKGWVAVTTILFSPLFGAIPAVACSSTEPATRNLNYTEVELAKDLNYRQAYVDQAHKPKRKKIWKSYFISSGFYILLLTLL